MANTFDFIVVGGGTSGCVVANRLANSKSAPKVLLLEAGGSNDDLDLRSSGNRYSLAFTNPELNWGYKSIPQPQLNNREIMCPRGRGLGGSSAINFSCWLIGDKEDFNEWAELVDDPCWKWEGDAGVKERFRKIENVHNDLTDEQARHISREALDEHSKQGMVDVSYPQIWRQLDFLAMEAGREFEQSQVNRDITSGNPLGFGIGPSTYYNGNRTTAASAYLSFPPPNLSILANSAVSKVLLDSSKRATGVITLDGKVYHASKDVILSAGVFDTPKILLLSGIGPSHNICKHSIPVILDIPGVGNNMLDHCYLQIVTLLKESAPSTGAQDAISPVPAPVPDPMIDTGLQIPMAWLSSSAVKSSPEFIALPQRTKQFLQKVPSYELLFSAAMPPQIPLPRPNAEVINLGCAVMNAQSTGSISLASSDPTAPMLIDLGYLSHPYDRRVAIEALRAAMALSRVPTFDRVIEKVLVGPKSESDEDLCEFAKEHVSPVYHFGATCRMGKADDEMSVVDNEFKVKGIQGLRVIDHSVAPLMINNHVQSTCYLIGETAAEKLIAEYGLDKSSTEL